ncbi:DUF1631 family protein [Paucibacter soli]|uniref:DUF1631 family protein n=1 Tax=Paucibacter soli TaxID=3133433 RepID=UPI0030A98042
MNPPELRLNPHLEAALQRVRTAAEQAAERAAEGLGMAALSAGQAKRRDALLAAQFLFRKQQALFANGFYQSLRGQLASSTAPATARVPEPASKASGKDWGELSLMDDDQVNAMVAADRIGLAIGHQSEWELREVESYIGNLAPASERPEDRNPLRPQVIAQALLDGIQAVSDDSETRQILSDELTRSLAQEMRACYADIAELLRSRGLRPQDLRVRGTASARAPGAAGGMAPPEAGNSAYGDLAMPRGGLPRMPAGWAGRGMAGAGAIGEVDPRMMDLLRRLAHMPAMAASGSPQGDSAYGQSGHYGSADGVPGRGRMTGWDEDYGEPGWAGQLPPNLIHAHREELREAASGKLDHMVIDVVGSLFDQILSDPKVPPQMARQIARLQLPVLRAALGDNSFFSSRKHPVRRFVNRIASLACAYDDFSEDPGKAFLALVRELVQEVANGDFDRMDLYETKLDALERFIGEQTSAALQAQGNATELLERKETDLRLQQRYMQQLQAALAPVGMPDFLRAFLAQIWSQAIVLAARDPKSPPERAERYRQFGRDIVLSVQPKAGSTQRQAFLASLPKLMTTLNEGLDLIRWPEAARKQFFGELLPAHADSLKGQALTPLEYNLLAKQLEGVFACAPPSEKDLPAGGAITVPAELDMGSRLSADEAKSLGLVNEAAVDWNGQVDIDLGAEEAPLQSVDISIDGLPAVEGEAEPSSGGLLIDHLQLGFAYQMHTGEQWHKVRLAHISAGRSFFIFTQGHKHQETVTMTARMLRKLCESGRLRAFENAYLIERATARARKQLAALNSRH